MDEQQAVSPLSVPAVGSVWADAHFPDVLTYVVTQTGGLLLPWVSYSAYNHRSRHGVGGGRTRLDNWWHMVSTEQLHHDSADPQCTHHDKQNIAYGWCKICRGRERGIDQQYVDADGNPVSPPASQVMEQVTVASSHAKGQRRLAQMPPVPPSTITIAGPASPRTPCPLCCWPVIVLCCNGPVAQAFPGEDWVAYCSNVTCANHSPAVRCNQGGIEWEN